MSLTIYRRARALRPRRAFTLRDVVVALFLVSLLLVAQARVAQRSREVADHINCASHLRQIGQAMHIYANANGGAFPRTMFDGTVNPIPTEYTASQAPSPFGQAGPGPNDVTAPLFLLLRTVDVTSDVFLCPKAAERWDVSPWPGDPFGFSNFPSRVHLSYGHTNPYPSQAALAAGFRFDNTLGPGFALAADMGPGGAAANVPANLPRTGMVAANSPNHGGDGQHVLYADGHVNWEFSPFCGSQRPLAGAPPDNIYTFGVNATPAAKSPGVRGAPQDAYDSVILPTADVGSQPSAMTRAARRRRTTLLFLGGGVLTVMAIGLIVVLGRRNRKTPHA